MATNKRSLSSTHASTAPLDLDCRMYGVAAVLLILSLVLRYVWIARLDCGTTRSAYTCRVAPQALSSPLTSTVDYVECASQ